MNSGDGVMFRGQGEEYDTFPEFDEEGPYRLENAMAGVFRVLLKHGYRYQITETIDAGFELGLGVSFGFGSITLRDTAEDGAGNGNAAFRLYPRPLTRYCPGCRHRAGMGEYAFSSLDRSGLCRDRNGFGTRGVRSFAECTSDSV